MQEQSIQAVPSLWGAYGKLSVYDRNLIPRRLSSQALSWIGSQLLRLCVWSWGQQLELVGMATLVSESDLQLIPSWSFSGWGVHPVKVLVLKKHRLLEWLKGPPWQAEMQCRVSCADSLYASYLIFNRWHGDKYWMTGSLEEREEFCLCFASWLISSYQCFQMRMGRDTQEHKFIHPLANILENYIKPESVILFYSAELLKGKFPTVISSSSVCGCLRDTRGL